jgi:hypothetical protein
VFFAIGRTTLHTTPMVTHFKRLHNTSGKGRIDYPPASTILAIKPKLKTNDWSFSVNNSLLAMCIVERWRVWTRLNQDKRGNQTECQKTFCGHLAAELINNSVDNVVRNIRRNHCLDEDENGTDTLLLHHLTGLAQGVYLCCCSKT